VYLWVLQGARLGHKRRHGAARFRPDRTATTWDVPDRAGGRGRAPAARVCASLFRFCWSPTRPTTHEPRARVAGRFLRFFSRVDVSYKPYLALSTCGRALAYNKLVVASLPLARTLPDGHATGRSSLASRRPDRPPGPAKNDRVTDATSHLGAPSCLPDRRRAEPHGPRACDVRALRAAPARNTPGANGKARGYRPSLALWEKEIAGTVLLSSVSSS